jgi:membrane associated rhomboid family serine protease
MPLTPAPAPKPASETVPELLHRANLHDFKVKAVLWSLATVVAAAVWLIFFDQLRVRFGMFVGVIGAQALKNIRLWREWRAANPHVEKETPDSLRERQQASLKELASAARERAWLTRGLVACIAVPSFLQAVVGLERSIEIASVEPVAIQSGEWWRLLGGTYLHGSLPHFLGNMTALLMYGSILEVKGGALRLPFVYLLAALGGSLASISLPPEGPSVGASGGIVGIIGYLFMFSRRQTTKFPAAFHGATASVLAGLFTFGALGYWFIDNAAHAGGALTGALLAALVVEPARNYGEEIPHFVVDLLGWMAVAILAAGSAITSMALLGIHR